MTDQTSISFANLTAKSDGVVVVFAEEGPKLTESAKAFDKESKGLLTKAMQMTDFKGKAESSVDLLAPASLNCSRIVLAGLGKPDEITGEDWLNLGGKVRAAVTGKEAPEAHVFLDGVKAEISAEDIANFALGTILRSYSFKKYKSKKNASDDGKKTPEKTLKKIVIHCADPRAAQRAFAKEKAVGKGVNFARDLVNEPANVLTPQEFAKRARTLAKLGVEVEVLTEQRLKRLGMNALLAVGQGSTQPSHVVVMQWNGAGEKGGAPVAFVGKGVVFDAGGISLKPASGMEDMKGDMAGAACVVGLMHELAERKAKVNAVGVIGVVENMPDGNATRPGDVVKAMSGTTIEVLNTDAEGRMVLADCLWYTQDRFKPKAMINLATLTGAVMVALGKEHAGLFSNNDDLSNELIKAGEESGEKLWRLPLGPKYDKLIDSKVADIKNTGGRWGGSISAAQFLQRFVKPETPWAHLDIAGMGMGSPETDVNRSWGSGFGVRLLDRLVRDQYEK
ncbi:Cytosol aminopeptidase [Methyloligella halotolerans]|uniref:Probable cytosol aminopeptidase n=1 Tax=Methyloligella halotolerans TaxID=1177755 RepID=A0A1E2S1Y5_9HYPH|nr:leucyl aminopeptidase [Methyloligella halotolerans]ODA68432.1 Cytosol aminopeptidase [Methyloligella halotolerans]